MIEPENGVPIDFPAIFHQSMGDYRKAIEYHKIHLKITLEIGDRAGEGRAYGNLGITYDSQGDYRKAIEYHEKYSKILLEIGNQAGERRRLC